MMSWISKNIANIIISLLILAAVAAIIINMVRNKKLGRSPTCSGCSGCPSANVCRDVKQETE